jgi:arylsulfatase A-like enzyme
MHRTLLPLIVVVLAACSEARPEKRIVLVTLDTLRYDAFADGDGTSRMPRTREWARRGRVFERYYSATSTTQPTHATLFSGLHPWQHGVSRNGIVLADGIETVVERIHDAGYRTAAVVASFPVASTFNFDQGFDRYHDRFQRGTRESEQGADEDEGHFYSGASYVVRRALEALDELGGRKQFFWFHFFDPHPPYGNSLGRSRRNPGWIITRIRQGVVDASEVLSEARAAYDADVAHLDKALDRLLRRLDDGVETHVLVASDHGESFGEHGSLGHGERLTPEQIRVPCFLLSQRVEPGTVDVPTGTIDLTATLLALADLDVSAQPGRDLTQARIEATRVLGMRRTFDAAATEVRVDLSQHTIEPGEQRFFVVDGSAYYTGNEAGVWLGDGEAALEDAGEARSLRELFAGFGEELRANAVEGVKDEESLRALRRLGYAE